MRTPLEFPFLAFLALFLAAYQVSATPALNLGRNLLFERTAQTAATPTVGADGCNYNGCVCHEGNPQGEYCGLCYGGVDYPGDTSVWPWDHIYWVYECNPSGGCCAYGYRTSCEKEDPLSVSPCGPTTTVAS
ncbi:hypothetical protein K440DRAFT_645710 [Wilcoxina mikolae CBS 423.85]|nr:hypothetical protein K440DRAFT_645710 [Wilcoxina mikolae CBS 423.85]